MNDSENRGTARDDDPTAGASDIGGRAGEPYDDDDDEGADSSESGNATGDRRGDDAHEVGGGHSGMGKGPTGS